MKKIPSVWVRDFSTPGALYKSEVTPGCEWVLAGEGVATRKWDGTAVLLRDGRLYARYDAKHGKTPPPGFAPCGEPDEKTGHWPGWVPADRPQDMWIREAASDSKGLLPYRDGTYEAIGPKIGGNPEGATFHALMKHGEALVAGLPRDFEGLKGALSGMNIEGIVFHHEDGRMAKATKQGFGLRRAP